MVVELNLNLVVKTDKMVGDPLLGLFAVAVAHALAVAVMISAGHISGGHLNPAVTLGLLFGGRITVFRSVLYWIAQLLASSAACLLLSYLTGGLVCHNNNNSSYSGIIIIILFQNHILYD